MPGRSERQGISLIQLFEMFPDEDAARQWFEETRWPDERACGKCGSVRTREVPNEKPMPYWCSDCRSYFSVKTGTVMQASNLPLRKWAIAIYLMTTNLKGVSSTKLARDLGIAQKNAWHMTHRIREAMRSEDPLFRGPVEADETYIGGRTRNMHASQRSGRRGRGVPNQTPVAGVLDRETREVSATPVDRVNRATLQGFVEDRTEPTATVYTDEWAGYTGLDRLHEVVRHGVGEYVRDQAHTNGLESFWAELKRGYQGVYHWFSRKHMHRYIGEFEGRHNDRPLDTIDQMTEIIRGMLGRRLRYEDLIGPVFNVQLRMV